VGGRDFVQQKNLESRTQLDELYSWGMLFKDSAIILDAIRRSFFTKSATAAMFTLGGVDFGRPPLSSSLPAPFRLEIESTI
jgi:hypothetical protein